MTTEPHRRDVLVVGVKEGESVINQNLCAGDGY